MANLRKWSVAKGNKHSLKGVTNPENWLWERINGTFYPIEEIQVEEVVVDEVYERMFELLDPDWSDEELEANGWKICDGLEYGSDAVVDYREGCGHIG